jgi:hypothetical protein
MPITLYSLILFCNLVSDLALGPLGCVVDVYLVA